MTSQYIPQARSSTQQVDIRGLNYTIHTWGKPTNPAIFFLHGWMDTGQTFQFLADSLSDDWYLISPDLRGFGATDKNPHGYWFPDYLADFEALLNIYSPDQTANLVGHSMGGNIACLYAGIRPKRVSHLVSLESAGLPNTEPSLAPERYAKWLDQLQLVARISEHSIEQLTNRVQALGPHMNQNQARFVAEAWSVTATDDKRTLLSDPRHKWLNPTLYRREEARSCWRRIEAKAMLITGSESKISNNLEMQSCQRDFKACIPHAIEKVVDAAGHMVHWDQPERVANHIESFLGQ